MEEDDGEFEGYEAISKKMPATPEKRATLLASAIDMSNKQNPARISLFHFFFDEFPTLPKYIQQRIQELDLRRNFFAQLDFSKEEDQRQEQGQQEQQEQEQRQEEQMEIDQGGNSSSLLPQPVLSTLSSPNTRIIWPSLTFLSLGANELTELPILAPMPNLTTLIANHNRITQITNLHYTPKLKVLDLRSNKIRVLENLKHVPDLERLSLSCNSVAEINTSTICQLDSLNFVSIFGNLITDIQQLLSFLEKTPKLKKLIVAGNLFFTTSSDSPPANIVHQIKSVVPSVEWIDWTYYPGSGTSGLALKC